jgi:polar amino acid transport system permease protein
LCAALPLLLAGCASNSGSYTWGWYIFNPLSAKGLGNIQFMAAGLGLTISLAVCAIVLSVLIGISMALAGMSSSRLLRSASRVYVECLRAIPLLVLLLWVYYGLPVITGLQFGAFTAGVLSLALSDSAFEAEVFRAGIQSVARGQSEAAHLPAGDFPSGHSHHSSCAWQSVRLRTQDEFAGIGHRSARAHAPRQ